MTSWAYRATPKGTSYARTVEIIVQHGFVWRPLFKATEQRSKTGLPPTYSHLGAIDPARDELFIYFAGDPATEYVGGFAFAAPRPERPPAHPSGLAPAIVQVPETDPLHAALQAAGYEPDSHLGVFTGFDVVPLDDGATPPGRPTFAGQYAIGTFPVEAAGAPPARPAAVAPATGSATLPTRTTVAVGRCYGVDWSGAARAGDKVWVAELDPAARLVRSVARPWRGQTAADTVAGVAAWLSTLTEAWVAFDFPFGLAATDRTSLLGEDLPDAPRAWGAALAERFPTVGAFIQAATDRGLIGVNRRATDGASPFGPLLLQLIRQTYWGLRLLAQVPADVALLPWDHELASTVRVLETCPAVLLRALGESNVGYKLRPGSDLVRAALLDAVLAATGWACAPEVRQAAISDREGDALDAVLAGLAAWRASAQDHAAITSLLPRLAEGHIYA
ncbi:MAG: DUF429 domain-containing protein [Planctomycetes bacterium]|nr:DUF429 domain-containing protein [Planctomycetota bacterium]